MSIRGLLLQVHNEQLTNKILLHSHSSYLYIIPQLTLQLTKLTKLYYNQPSQLTNYIIDLLHFIYVFFC
jgi:hypothetical protein